MRDVGGGAMFLFGRSGRGEEEKKKRRKRKMIDSYCSFCADADSVEISVS